MFSPLHVTETISGARRLTGIVPLLYSTVYDIMKNSGVNYIGFMAWIGM